MNWSSYLAALLSVTVASAAVAQSVRGPALIESGLYWDPNSPGLGVGLEVQGDTAAVYLYAFDSITGAGEIYTGAGQLRDDALIVGPGLDGFFAVEGLFPIRWFTGDLFKAEHGPCLVCEPYNAPAEEEKVGTVSMWFAHTGRPYAEVLLNGPAGGVRSTFLERFSFGRERIGVPGLGTLLHFDLRGEWVFTDLLDGESTPLRLSLTRRSPDAPFDPATTAPISVQYYDDARGIEVRCRTQPRQGPDVRNGGCEFLFQGEIRYSAIWLDIGLDRIRAFPGELTPMQEEPYRREGTIVGVRLE